MFNLAQWQNYFTPPAVNAAGSVDAALPPAPVGTITPIVAPRSPAMTPLVLESSAPHQHVWFQACLRDQFGLTVYDCACGMRKRTRQGPGGMEQVEVPPPDNVLGDVLFDMSQIAAPALPPH